MRLSRRISFRSHLPSEEPVVGVEPAGNGLPVFRRHPRCYVIPGLRASHMMLPIAVMLGDENTTAPRARYFHFLVQSISRVASTSIELR